jgi:hypothetical protein
MWYAIVLLSYLVAASVTHGVLAERWKEKNIDVDDLMALSVFWPAILVVQPLIAISKLTRGAFNWQKRLKAKKQPKLVHTLPEKIETSEQYRAIAKIKAAYERDMPVMERE